MPEELLGDARCVIRSFKLYQEAKSLESKKNRLENFKNLAKNFEEKWNPIIGQTLKFSEWLQLIGRSESKNEIYPRASR